MNPFPKKACLFLREQAGFFLCVPMFCDTIHIESEEYDTLNGYLISKLDRIPDDDEKAVVKSDGLVFKITEVSGNVIRKVEITRDEQAQTDNAQAQE